MQLIEPQQLKTEQNVEVLVVQGDPKDCLSRDLS
jgi:hypothetical protein